MSVNSEMLVDSFDSKEIEIKVEVHDKENFSSAVPSETIPTPTIEPIPEKVIEEVVVDDSLNPIGKTLEIKKGKHKKKFVTIKDWHKNLYEVPYYKQYGNPLTREYLTRISIQNFCPIDDQVLVGEIDGQEIWIHYNELELKPYVEPPKDPELDRDLEGDDE